MLQMTPETMRELAHQVTDILVDRIEHLPGERAWEGDFNVNAATWLTASGPSQTLELASASLGMVCFRVNPDGLSTWDDVRETLEAVERLAMESAAPA